MASHSPQSVIHTGLLCVEPHLISLSSSGSALHSRCPRFHNGLWTAGITTSSGHCLRSRPLWISLPSLSVALPHNESENSFFFFGLVSSSSLRVIVPFKDFPRPIYLYPSPTLLSFYEAFYKALFPWVTPGKARCRSHLQWNPHTLTKAEFIYPRKRGEVRGRHRTPLLSWFSLPFLKLLLFKQEKIFNLFLSSKEN